MVAVDSAIIQEIAFWLSEFFAVEVAVVGDGEAMGFAIDGEEEIAIGDREPVEDDRLTAVGDNNCSADVFLVFDEANDRDGDTKCGERCASRIGLSLAAVNNNQIRKWPFLVIETSLEYFRKHRNIAAACGGDVEFPIKILIRLAIYKGNH